VLSVCVDQFFHLDVEILERLEVLAHGFPGGVEAEDSRTHLTHVALKSASNSSSGHSMLAFTLS
jgi:hypothetical protein